MRHVKPVMPLVISVSRSSIPIARDSIYSLNPPIMRIRKITSSTLGGVITINGMVALTVIAQTV
ncbi:Uncharacterised protein [Vibrio cholerae]|nr:Uncharacterised protein [Vibrio cholerae]